MGALDVVSGYLPDIGLGQIGNFIIFGAIALMVLFLLAVGTYFLIMILRFNKKLVYFEDVSGSDDVEPIGRDRGMLVKTGKSGIEILYSRKRKQFLTAYGKRMGKNTYYFAKGPDGYYYNFTLGSLTDGMKKVGIKPTNVNMRYQNEALMEVIKSRYDQTTFWEKYGGVIAFVALIAMLGIMAYLVLGKFGEVTGGLNQAVETTKLVLEENKRVISALDALEASGGIKPAIWLSLLP